MPARDLRDNVNATATGTNAGATATITGATNKRYYVTHASGVSDAASAFQILGGSNGTTVIYQLTLQANVPFAVNLIDAGIQGTVGQNVSAKIASSTSACAVNIAAFQTASV